MIKNKNKIERKKDLNHIIYKNDKNIIIIQHSKNKSVDVKASKKYNYFLSSLKDNLKNGKFKSNSNLKINKKIYFKREKDSKKSNDILKDGKSNLKISNNDILNIINLKNFKKLKKYSSQQNLKERNKKRYFFGPNFFHKNKNKNKININQELYNSKKENDTNIIHTSLYNNENNNKYSKRIINRKNNIVKENLLQKYLQKENEESKTCDISNNCNNKYIGENNSDIKPSLIKSNILYNKVKINKIPYRNKNGSSSKINWNQKKPDKKLDIKKNESIIKNILDDSLDSHNMIYVEDNNINEYEYFDDKLNRNNDKTNDNEKLYKKIITRKRNLLTESLNNSNSKNKSSRYHSTKNNTNCSDKSIFNSGINLKSQILYQKVSSKRISSSINNKNNKNFFSSFSLITTHSQNNKYKEYKDKQNECIDKEVTEFLYSEDLIEGNYKYKYINLKKWLLNINLGSYSQKFYENNIYNINELINKMKKETDKKLLYEYIENSFHIHVPGHIYRILLKLEIDAGLIDEKISNFFIDKNNENRIKFNKIEPSLLLNQYNNSCDNFYNNYNSNIKNRLKLFLKKYHLIHLYYNFCQNGFDLINFVLLQMFSKYYIIDDYILENCFHIYNKNDRYLTLESLYNEKNLIDSFLQSIKIKEGKNNNFDKNNDNMNFNSNSYNNFDNYFITKDSERNDCNICNIY